MICPCTERSKVWSLNLDVGGGGGGNCPPRPPSVYGPESAYEERRAAAQVAWHGKLSATRQSIQRKANEGSWLSRALALPLIPEDTLHTCGWLLTSRTHLPEWSHKQTLLGPIWWRHKGTDVQEQATTEFGPSKWWSRTRMMWNLHLQIGSSQNLKPAYYVSPTNWI